MNIFVSILVVAVSWLIGLFGWAQIIGGFQNLRTRKGMLFVIVLWIAIIGASFFVVRRFFAGKILAWAIGIVISLVQVLGQGRIE